MPDAAQAHLRPRVHFTPPTGWMNDPNGLIYWQGRYHLFYQHNPAAARWGNIHWGHAVSSDLVRWRHQPIALSPTPGGPDEDGCWSGCAVSEDGVPRLIYSGLRGGQTLPCLADGTADLGGFSKRGPQPLLHAPQVSPALSAFRDPSVWRDGRHWRMLSGAGHQGGGGTLWQHRAQHLQAWTDEGEYRVHGAGGELLLGEVWECPQLLDFRDTQVLLVSVWAREPRHAVWLSGQDAGTAFVADQAGRLDHGEALYAPQALRDADGQWTVFGWLREGRSAARQLHAGWSGALCFPRTLTLGSDGALYQRPAPAVRSLRGPAHRFGSRRVDVSDVPAAWLSGGSLELHVGWRPESATRFGLSVLAAPDRSEETLIMVDPARQELLVDRSRSGRTEQPRQPVVRLPFAVSSETPCEFTVFVDGSVIEVFTPAGQALATRVYPEQASSVEVYPFCQGGHATLAFLSAWKLQTQHALDAF